MPSQIIANTYNTIPQFFYDLIARVFPGYIVILIYNFVFTGTGFDLKNYGNNISGDVVSTLFQGVAFVILCYFVSWVLRAFTFKSYRYKAKRKYEKIDHEFQTSDPINTMYQWIRISYPQVGLRIVKLRAEAKMLECVRTGMVWIIIFAILLYFCDKLDLYSCPLKETNIWLVKLFIPVIMAFSCYKAEKPMWEKYYRTIPVSYNLLKNQTNRIDE